MTLKKILTYLKNIGLIFVALSFVTSLALYHHINGFMHNNILYYLLLLGVLMHLPLDFYKLWHYKAYKKENKNLLIHIGIWVFLIAVFIIIKGDIDI